MFRPLFVVGCLTFLAIPSSVAQSAPSNFLAALSPVNNSGVSGTASITLNGNDLTVVINATGLETGQIHPQHILGFVNGQASSVSFSDFNSNGLIDSFEADLATGPAILPLTNSADFQANPLTDFPITSNGTLNFTQTYVLAADMLASLSPLNTRAIELQGLSVNGTYNPELPVAAGLVQDAGGGNNGIPLPPAAWTALVTVAAIAAPRMLRRRYL
jgi:hypothetical protein